MICATEKPVTAIITLILIVFLVSGCGEKQAAKKEMPPIPIDFAEITAKDTPYYLEGIGNVLAFNTVDVKSRVTGELIEIKFNEGDYVNEGQELFIIDPEPFRAKVREGEARLNQSKVQYDQARREYVRFTALYNEKAISQEQLETKETDMNSKLYQMHLSQAELETAKLNLGYCFIKAQLAGKTGKRYVDNFNIINANQDRLTTIRQTQPIKVNFSVPGKYLDKIREYNQEGPLEVEAEVPGDKKPEFGKLSLIDNSINLRTGMLVLEAVLPNSDAKLWPGLFVHVRLRLSVTKDAVLVPYKAVSDGPEGQYVWLMNPDQTVIMRPVRLDRRAGDMMVVSEGLKPGEKVITEGQLLLSPGARVMTRAQVEEMKKKAMSGGPAGKAK